MAFVTEIPNVQEAQQWQAEKWLHNEFSLWTIDRARQCYLIFQRETPSVNSLPAREDYYFYYQGKGGVVSTVLKLAHEGNELVYRWRLISSYGLAYQLRTSAHVLLVGQGGDTRQAADLSETQAQEAMACLQEAFLAHKAYLGVRNGGSQKVIFDISPVSGQDEDWDV